VDPRQVPQSLASTDDINLIVGGIKMKKFPNKFISKILFLHSKIHTTNQSGDLK
jgi:hypothetical protein